MTETPNPRTAADAVWTARQQQQKPNGSATENAIPKLTSAAELLAREFKEPKYAVPHLIAEGLTILAGKPKTGKSWAALDFAVAVAGGYSALGNIDCQQGDVLLLALEDNERRLHQRLKAVCRGNLLP
jgi:RecA-family ATPase